MLQSLVWTYVESPAICATPAVAGSLHPGAPLFLRKNEQDCVLTIFILRSMFFMTLLYFLLFRVDLCFKVINWDPICCSYDIQWSQDGDITIYFHFHILGYRTYSNVCAWLHIFWFHLTILRHNTPETIFCLFTLSVWIMHRLWTGSIMKNRTNSRRKISLQSSRLRIGFHILKRSWNKDNFFFFTPVFNIAILSHVT